MLAMSTYGHYSTESQLPDFSRVLSFHVTYLQCMAMYLDAEQHWCDSAEQNVVRIRRFQVSILSLFRAHGTSIPDYHIGMLTPSLPTT